MGDPFINPSLDSLPSPFNGSTVEGDFFVRLAERKNGSKSGFALQGFSPERTLVS